MGTLDLIASKIFTWESISRQCAIWRFKDQKVVFTNGCFDLLHLGHIEYLAKASELGNVLIIGLNSDISVRKIKGPYRPYNNEHARAMVLASLSFVNAVVLFNEETPYELIRAVQPDILVKGKDYKIEDIAGNDIVLANGGQIITIELTPGYSTTGIEDLIIRLHKNKNT
jgi:D-glycero-beta-D-manno-heptose 1-phosphate adenylyltransferase